MKDGYILLYRQITENPLWKEKPFHPAMAWIDLLMKANFKDTTTVINGETIVLKRGQLFRSIDSLATDWGWSRNRVYRFLQNAKRNKMCNTNGTPNGTLITIENYETYQDGRNKVGTPNGTTNGTTDGTQYKESKRKINKERDSVPPSLADVSKYVQQMGYRMDPEAFYDYYAATNWTKKSGQKIRDWKAAVRTWERREKNYEKEKDPPGKPAQIEPPKYKQFEPEPKVDAVPMPASVREKLKSIELLEDLQ